MCIHSRQHKGRCRPELVVLAGVVDPKAEDARSERLHGARNDQLGVRQQKQVAESGAKVGTVDVGLFGGPGVVDLVAPRAEHLHGKLPSDVRQADRQDGLALA